MLELALNPIVSWRIPWDDNVFMVNLNWVGFDLNFYVLFSYELVIIKFPRLSLRDVFSFPA